MSAMDDMYERDIRPLPATERLRLARRILDDLPPESVVDYSEAWSDEDLSEVSHFSLQQAAQSFVEEPDVA